MSGNSKVLRVDEALFSPGLKGMSGKYGMTIITVRRYPFASGRGVQDKETATGAAVAGRVMRALWSIQALQVAGKLTVEL